MKKKIIDFDTFYEYALQHGINNPTQIDDFYEYSENLRPLKENLQRLKDNIASRYD